MYQHKSFEYNQQVNKQIDATLKALSAKRGNMPLELIPLCNSNDTLTRTTTHVWSK